MSRPAQIALAALVGVLILGGGTCASTYDRLVPLQAQLAGSKERKPSIEVGHGLEDKVPDLRAAQSLDEVLAPRLRAGERDTAVLAAVDALLATIEGRALALRGPPPPRVAEEPLDLLGGVALGAFVLAFGALFTWRPSLALWLLSSLFKRGRGRGGKGSGGVSRSGGGGGRGGW